MVYAQSGVGHDVEPGRIISGSPAFDYREWRRSAMAFPKLGELVRLVRQLENRIAQLESPSPEPKDKA